MKARMIIVLVLTGFLVSLSGVQQCLWAQSTQELIEKADQLYEKGELEAYKEAVRLYEKAAEAAPDDFEANWKAARACRYFAEKARNQEISGWEGICEEYGKKGMGYAQKAIELEPDKPNGYYYYGLCVGSYSDGVSIITALRKGLKGKTQKNLEKAYEINKNFDNGGPMVALGRFWQIVPWPYNDKRKAFEYYKEFQKSEHFNEDTQQALHHKVYMGELMADKKGGEDEAKKLLQEALKMTDEPYWEEYAKKILNEL